MDNLLSLVVKYEDIVALNGNKSVCLEIVIP